MAKTTKAHAPRPAPGSPEALQAEAITTAKRSWGGLDSAVASDLKRLLSLHEEEDRLVERVNKNWTAQRDVENSPGGRAANLVSTIAPGRRRDVVVELQRRRPLLLDNPPLRMPVMAPPPPTPEMAARAARAAERDAANVRRFNPAVAGTIPSGVSGL